MGYALVLNTMKKNHRVDGLKHRELFELVFTYLYKTTITVALIYKFINKT
jgi:hypothetical protein